MPMRIALPMSSARGTQHFVHERLPAEKLHFARGPLAELLRDPDRARIVRPDEAHHAVAAQLAEGEVERDSRRLGRIAPPPVLAADHPSDLEAGPAGRVEEPGAPHEDAIALALERPHAIAEELPVPEHAGDRAPRLPARERLAGPDVAHRLGVGGHGRVRIEILAAKVAQDKS